MSPARKHINYQCIKHGARAITQTKSKRYYISTYTASRTIPNYTTSRLPIWRMRANTNKDKILYTKLYDVTTCKMASARYHIQEAKGITYHSIRRHEQYLTVRCHDIQHGACAQTQTKRKNINYQPIRRHVIQHDACAQTHTNLYGVTNNSQLYSVTIRNTRPHPSTNGLSSRLYFCISDFQRDAHDPTSCAYHTIYGRASLALSTTLRPVHTLPYMDILLQTHTCNTDPTKHQPQCQTRHRPEQTSTRIRNTQQYGVTTNCLHTYDEAYCRTSQHGDRTRKPPGQPNCTASRRTANTHTTYNILRRDNMATARKHKILPNYTASRKTADTHTTYHTLRRHNMATARPNPHDNQTGRRNDRLPTHIQHTILYVVTSWRPRKTARTDEKQIYHIPDYTASHGDNQPVRRH
jgi:hypothetical protein